MKGEAWKLDHDDRRRRKRVEQHDGGTSLYDDATPMTITRIFSRARDEEPWSSVLIGMVTGNSSKPGKKSPRLRSVRPPNDTQHPAPTPHYEIAQNLTTDSPERPSKRTKLTRIDSYPPAARSLSAPTSDSDITAPRPPTKLTLTEPRGDVLQTTNGVCTTIAIGDGGIQTGASLVATPENTPHRQIKESATNSKSQDKRTLRSHDEGGRLKSDLATYFPNYEDVINDTPTEPGKSSGSEMLLALTCQNSLQLKLFCILSTDRRSSQLADRPDLPRPPSPMQTD